MTVMASAHRLHLVPLSEVIAAVKPGFAVGERAPDGVIQVRMNNVDTDGNLDLNDVIRVPATEKQIADCSLISGDVLFNNTNSTELVGKSTVFREHSEPVTFSNHFTRLRVDAKRLDPFYLARWLTRQQQCRVFEGLCTRWVGQSAVRSEKLLGLKIPLPPLPEQKRIADILDKASAIRRKRQTVQNELLSLPRRLFNQMFGNVVQNERGWTIVKVADAGEVQLGRQRSPKYQSGKFTRPYMRVANVYEDRLDLRDVLSMDFDERDFATYKLEFGDLLLNEGQSTELVGRPAMWRGDLPDCCFQNTLVRFRADPEVTNPEFALAVFREYLQRGAFARISSKTSSVAHLGARPFAAMPFPLPARNDQDRFATLRDQLRHATDHTSRAYSESKALFSTIVHRAFRGEL